MQILKAGICSKGEVRGQSPSATRSPRRIRQSADRGEKSEVRSLFANKGFTLLELIIVIFILSLIAGLVMPSFYGIGEGRLKSEAGKIASILRYLNDSAIARKETIPLKISLDDRTLRWETTEGEKAERFDSLFSLSTTSTGRLSTGEVTLFFSTLGLQEALIVMLKDNNKEMSVSFNPLSGRVKILQNEK